MGFVLFAENNQAIHTYLVTFFSHLVSFWAVSACHAILYHSPTTCPPIVPGRGLTCGTPSIGGSFVSGPALGLEVLRAARALPS